MTDKGGKPWAYPLGFKYCDSFCHWWRDGKCDFRRIIRNVKRRKEREETLSETQKGVGTTNPDPFVIY